MTTDDSNKVHDLEKVIDALRDNLAQHDKPISFLFGAGTSCSVRDVDPKDPDKCTSLIPAVYELTSDCKNHAISENKKFEKAWSLIKKECNNSGQSPHIENILSYLRMIIQVIGDAQLLGLSKEEIMSLEECICKKIACKVSPNLDEFQGELPHRKFANWLAMISRKHPVEIFTLNYDVLLEYALECEQIPFFDGFVGSYQPFFNAESLHRMDSAPGSNWVRLWKMHGSVNWKKVSLEGRERIIRGKIEKDGAMIYPSYQKYDESRQQPYSAFADRLRRFLELDDSLLIICGYSFGDEHINQIIFDSLFNRPRTHVYVLQYREIQENSILKKYASKRDNMIVLGEFEGIIGCQHLKWNSFSPITHLGNIIKFSQNDTDSKKTDSSEGNWELSFKIGDFKYFCDFLNDMKLDEETKG